MDVGQGVNTRVAFLFGFIHASFCLWFWKKRGKSVFFFLAVCSADEALEYSFELLSLP